NEERVLAADAVAHPSEQECAKGPDQETGREQRNRAQQGCNGMGLLEELDRQDRGQASENVKIIPFDNISYRRGDDHAPKILRDFSRHVVLLPCQSYCLGRIGAASPAAARAFPSFASRTPAFFLPIVRSDEKGTIAGNGGLIRLLA